MTRKQIKMFGAIAILLLACTNYLYSRPYTASDIGEGVSRTSYEIGNTNNRTRIVPSAKSGKRYLSVVLRTWQEDAQLALLGMQSAVERIPDNQLLELVIVTDQTSADVVQSKLYQPLLEQYQDLRQRDGIRLHIEEPFLKNGHIQQKYSKMMADTYARGDYILHIDSDCVILKWDESCFRSEEDGKPVNDFATYDQLRKATAPNISDAAWIEGPNIRQWKNGTDFVLGLGTNGDNHEWSRLNQHVYPRELYPILRQRVEQVHNVSFHDSFLKLKMVGTFDDLRSERQKGNNPVLVSDFNLLGATAFYFAPDLMFSKNLTSPGTAWRPICVSQCNARIYSKKCCQQWMHEEMLKIDEGKGDKVPAHLPKCKTFSKNQPCSCMKNRTQEILSQRSLGPLRIETLAF